VQKVGASYVFQKVSDYVMTPPKSAEVAEEPGVEEPVPVDAGLDGQVITDEDGARLGIARRVGTVAVYVIADSRRDLEDHLKATIEDPEGRVFFHHADNGRLAGLIYVPQRQGIPSDVDAVRADDI
jgi:hypothetical protein